MRRAALAHRWLLLAGCESVCSSLNSHLLPWGSRTRCPSPLPTPSFCLVLPGNSCISCRCYAHANNSPHHMGHIWLRLSTPSHLLSLPLLCPGARAGRASEDPFSLGPSTTLHQPQSQPLKAPPCPPFRFLILPPSLRPLDILSPSLSISFLTVSRLLGPLPIPASTEQQGGKGAFCKV